MKKASDTVVEYCRTKLARQEPTHSDRSAVSNAPEPAKSAPSQSKTGLFSGVLTGFDPSGLALVKLAADGAGKTVAARSIVALSISQIGSEVALMFEQGSFESPIIMGPIQRQCDLGRASHFQIALDGQKVILSADEEVELRCGKASITLTRAGKILISGAYLLSRSSGVNRVKGASVQIN